MKRDNRGMTLLEVLIAVIILSIVIIPFLHSFVTSYTVNAKSRQTMRATTLAQNEMELFEKEKLEDLKDDNLFPDYIKTFDSMDGSIEFKREGVINDDSGRKMFDVYVTLDPMRQPGEQYAEINSEEVTNINTLSALDTARYVQPIRTKLNRNALDESIYKKFVDSSKKAGKNKDVDFFEKEVQRTFTLEISKVDDNTNVMLYYEYDAPADMVSAGENKIKSHLLLYDNAQLKNKDGEKVELKSVYLFYAPRYIANNDIIHIKNTANVEADIYIIRQDLLKKNSNTDIEKAPDNYSLNLIIDDKNTEDSKPSARYHTNLNIDSGVAGDGNGKFLLNLNGLNKIGAEREAALADLNMTDLSGKTIKDRIYNMEVRVYRVGADVSTEVPFVSLTGTKLE